MGTTTFTPRPAIDVFGQKKQDLLRDIEFEFLIRFSIDSRLINIRKYYTKKDVVYALSRKMNLEQCKFVHDSYLKGNNAIKTAEDFLNKMNPTSRTIRTKFVEYLIQIQEITSVLNDVCFFEFNVGGARTDINRINSRYSYAFEIKTARDRPERAFFQTKEFSQLFEFVYIIKNPDNEIEIDENIGVFLIDYSDGGIIFEKEVKATRNETNPEKQLMSLPKAKLREKTGLKSNEKADIANDILSKYDGNEINTFFKKTLKDIYIERWVEFFEKHSPVSVPETLLERQVSFNDLVLDNNY